MTRVLDAVHLVLKLALGLLVGVLVIPVAMQVLSRFSGLVPRYIWTEEIARFCFVWMIMIGAMCAVRDGTHFDLEVLPPSENPRIEALRRLFVNAMIFVVAMIFIWYGWRFMLFGWYQTSEIASLPMNWIFVAWPLMGVVTIAFLAEKVVPDLALLRRPRP